MIKKYKQFNENIKSLLVGPTDEDVLKSFKKLDPETILLKSIENSFIPGILYAIEKGVDITYDDNKLLRRSVRNNNYELVKSCLEHGADVHAQSDYSIQQSCEFGYYDITKLCIKYGADIYSDSNYPLLISSAKGSNDIVKLLLKNGEFNKYTITTAIDYAEHNEQTETVKILKEYIKDNQFNESIRSLLVGPTEEEILIPLYKKWEISRWELLERSIKIDYIDGIKFALKRNEEKLSHWFRRGIIHCAIVKNDMNLVKEMIKLGTEVTPYDLTFASQYNHYDIFKYLMKKRPKGEDEWIMRHLKEHGNKDIIELFQKEIDKPTNESIRSLLVGPTKEEVWYELMNGKLKGLIDSVPNSPEDFFLKMKKGCEIINRDEYGNIYWGKNNDMFFYIESSSGDILFVRKSLIWSILEKIYGLNYNEIESLITNLLVNDKNWKYLQPICSPI